MKIEFGCGAAPTKHGLKTEPQHLWVTCRK